MTIYKNIIDFILFRLSFKIETNLNRESVKQVLLGWAKRDKNVLSPIFDNYEFAFSHKKTLSNFFNFSLIYFEGEIKNGNKTRVIITSRIMPMFFWIFAFAILSILMSYFLDFDGMKNEFRNSPFPFNPIIVPVLILILYLYYSIKTFDVKSNIKAILKREENNKKTLEKQ